MRPADPRRITATLSGGNQQKLVLAREIERDPLVLVVGQPTRGVDIGAIEFIYRRLLALRDAGKAILRVSVELDEVMGLSDRILVMFGGAIVGELPAARATEQELGLTTIMFNFIAAALMVYLLVNVMSEPGSMQPETRAFAPHARLPFVHDILASVGIEVAASPLNLSFVWALLCSAFVWLFIWHTRAGYRLRTAGFSPPAAFYGGISPARQVLVAMLVSGALAGCMSLNELMGVQHRLLLEFSAGYGFAGIAVALMGRGHPMGILLASLLFGALYQGGAELSFEIPRITRDIALAALIFGKWRPVPAMFACLLFGFLEAVAIRLQGADVPGVGAVPVQLVQALPYILTVVLLAGFIGRAIPLRALGVPYVKER